MMLEEDEEEEMDSTVDQKVINEGMRDLSPAQPRCTTLR
jgi:hypothetical protein